jgi:hypothetical protein
MFVKNEMSEAYTRKPVKELSRVWLQNFLKILQLENCFLSSVIDFTGIDSPYETPIQAHLSLRTGETSIEECTQQLVDLLVNYVRYIII